MATPLSGYQFQKDRLLWSLQQVSCCTGEKFIPGLRIANAFLVGSTDYHAFPSINRHSTKQPSERSFAFHRFLCVPIQFPTVTLTWRQKFRYVNRDSWAWLLFHRGCSGWIILDPANPALLILERSGKGNAGVTSWEDLNWSYESWDLSLRAWDYESITTTTGFPSYNS